MKKLITFIVVLFSTFIFAQTQDLYSLAKGDYLGFNALFDDNSNLYGYIALYGYGKSGDKTKKFEYVILDKNLNPVANKEFEGDITTKDYFGYIDFRKKLVLYPTTDRFIVKDKDFFYPRSKEINLAENSIKNKIYYDYKDGKFTEETEPKNVRDSRKEDKAEKKLKGYNYISVVYEIKEGGFLVFEFNDYGNYTNNENLLRYDENKNLLWTYKYNTEGNKKNSESIRIFEKDENYIYCILTKEVKREKSFFLQIMDIKTGKVVSQQPIVGLSKESLENMTHVYSYIESVDNDKTFDDKIVMVFKNYQNIFRHTGFVRFVLDKKNLDFSIQELNYIDLKTTVPEINEYGEVGSGYRLDIKDFYFLEDGSVGILMEKLKPEGEYNAPKTTDLVYAYTDKDFKLSGAKVFKKEKTKWAINADYLFSQYLNDGNDVVFFYRDLQKDENTKEKNWNLFINTLINGQFNQEKVQISEKDNFTVIPYVAKDGYILLREFNEKEKFNKIRLERLNY